jgi:hypothetical protein
MAGVTKQGDCANCAGDHRCRPARILAPSSREELAEAVATRAPRAAPDRDGDGDGDVISFERLLAGADD